LPKKFQPVANNAGEAAPTAKIPYDRWTKRFAGRYGFPIQQLIWLKIILAIALICGFVLSWRLWISSRVFPLSPISDLLPPVPQPFDYIWFFVVMAMLVLIVIRPQWPMLTISFLVLAILLSFWDQNRWQPWFYQYVLMLAAIAYGIRTMSQRMQQRPALIICRVILVCTYVWSGIQKLNANFVKEAWPNFVTSLQQLLPRRIQLPPALALAVPILEITIGLGLSTRRFRQPAAVLAILTHLFVLLLLIASGENTVVWPWNLAMILLVIVLFWRDGETTARNLIVPKHWLHAIALLLVGIMPAFSLFGWWDSYLSSALYSGNTDQAVIYMSPEVIARLPAAARPHVWQETRPFFLDINRWSYGELNVPLYPEPRIYKNIAKQICAYAGTYSSDVRLRIKLKPNLFTAYRNSVFYDCDHLD
jgi:uncharacterized membrane protein YphA (DoxX/SURF4 family)